MEVYEERFCESRDYERKMWDAYCVSYRLKESIFVDVAGLLISGRNDYNSFILVLTP